MLYNQTLSDFLPLFAGVPQGTKLGSIAFQAVINDVAVGGTANYWKYVDDLTFAENRLSSELSNLQGDLANSNISQLLVLSHTQKTHFWLIVNASSYVYIWPAPGLQKCSVCLGPSTVMGKIFCQICARSTHHKHIAWSPYERGSGQGHFNALWCNLHLYLNLFCVNIIIFYFLVLNIFCGVNFFLGPVVPWSCGFCRPGQHNILILNPGIK